jgi:hypothetical protein
MGPNGEPGYAQPPGVGNTPANAIAYVMPDGTFAYYVPGATPDPGNVAGLANYQQAQGPTSGTATQKDAMAILQSVFQQYGFSTADQSALATWAWGLITQGYDATAIETQLYQTPQFKSRFPGIFARQSAGLPPISPGDYVSYENQMAQYANQFGIPQNFVKQYTDTWIGGDTSAAEAGQRMQDYSQAAYASNPAILQQLDQLYGVTQGELMAFFADPVNALPIITKRWQASQIAGQAQISGYNQLSQRQAEILQQQGVTAGQAQQGFQQLGMERQLFGTLPGQEGQGISQDQQLGAQFLGDAQAARLIELTRQQRLAAFQGGGQYAGGTRGLTGLGTEVAAQAT